MAHTRQKLKGRRNRSGSFSALVHEYFESMQYTMLSARAVKALVDLYCQYRGNNNGDLTAAWSVMHARGWRSKDQLKKALDELEHRGWIIKTRIGGIHAPTLYALTFLGIDPCGGKLDSGIRPDKKPLHLWRLATGELPCSKRRVKKKSVARDTGHAAPPHGTQTAQIRGSVPRTAVQS